jgi:hypothetical protein
LKIITLPQTYKIITKHSIKIALNPKVVKVELVKFWPKFLGLNESIYQDFVRGPNSKDKKLLGPHIKSFTHFYSEKRTIQGIFLQNGVPKSSLQGPQKMFGGPQFGHVWYIR